MKEDTYSIGVRCKNCGYRDTVELPVGQKAEGEREMKKSCKKCHKKLKETKLSKGSHGILMELRCSQCKTLFYMERKR